MRGQVLFVALLSAAPGHSVLPSASLMLPSAPRVLRSTPLAAPLPMPGLAPSPYVPELASNPFARHEAARTEALPRLARPRSKPRYVASLAPSPYDLELLSSPYAGYSPAHAVLNTASFAVGVNLEPRVLAPSPYEPQLASALAPSPY